MLVSSFLDRRGLKAGYRSSAAMALALLALTPVQAQDAQQNNTQQNSTVGSPQLRDFSLPGQRTTPPPAPEPEPVPTIPPATEQPRPTPAPAPAPSPTRAAPVREQPRQAPAPTPATDRERAVPGPAAEASLVNEAPAPPVAAPDPVLPQSKVLAPPPPAAPVERSVAEPLPAEPDGGFPWLALLLAGGVGVLGLLGYRRFAASRTEAYAAPAPEPIAVPKAVAPPAAPPRPAPAAAPAAPAPASIGIKLRPQLELEFKPDKAAATLTDANVQFELKVRNSGNMAARNIRIEARMFNAGAEQDREIGAFFARQAQEAGSSTLPAIPPRGEVAFKSTVTMPKDAVREINVQGRRLFIPMVAFNVFYDWADGKTGQTSMSYIVGREAPTPSEKMGAFRLDLGPRVYRSVGQRQTTLERVV